MTVTRGHRRLAVVRRLHRLRRRRRRRSSTGTLAGFRTAHSGWANGLADNPGSDTKWDAGDTVTYRVQLTVQDDNNAQGKVTGTHRIMWEARNQ